MEDFLTDIEPNTSKHNNLFSKLAFAFAVVSTILFMALILSSAAKILHRNSFVFSRIFAWGTDACILAGTVFSIISIVKKEKLKYFKTIGTIANFLYFSLIAIAVIFAVIMRYKRVG